MNKKVKMNNRKRIESFCKNNKLEIKELKFIRYTEHIYGSSLDSSYWLLETNINRKKLYFDSNNGDTVSEGVSQMLSDISLYRRLYDKRLPFQIYYED